jgi:tetratricopeptide (TPR) repeat protein
MLNFFDRLLTIGGNLENLGLVHQACSVFERIAGMRELPNGVASAAQGRLGSLRLEQGRFAKARRHLAALLVREPNNAQAHYQLACALSEDSKGDAERATRHFRRCLALDADNPDYLFAFARHALGTDLHAEGLELVRRFMRVAVDDVDLLAQACDELRRHGEPEEARSHLRLALFRHPRDRRFQQLWRQHQFQMLWAEQQGREPDVSAEVEEAVVLPFTPPAAPRSTRAPSRRILRTDRATERKGPHLPRTRRLPR